MFTPLVQTTINRIKRINTRCIDQGLPFRIAVHTNDDTGELINVFEIVDAHTKESVCEQMHTVDRALYWLNRFNSQNTAA